MVLGEQETSTTFTPQGYVSEVKAQRIHQLPQLVAGVHRLHPLLAASVPLSVCLNSLRVISGGGQMIAWLSCKSFGNRGSPGVFTTRNPKDSIHATSSANTKLPGRKDGKMSSGFTRRASNTDKPSSPCRNWKRGFPDSATRYKFSF